jgi:competence protein ComFB
MFVKVVNYMEVIVKENMASILKGQDICLCETCSSDIAAIALNNLKPRYYATDKGFLFSKLKAVELQALTDVMTEVIRAADMVKGRPRH